MTEGTTMHAEDARPMSRRRGNRLIASVLVLAIALAGLVPHAVAGGMELLGVGSSMVRNPLVRDAAAAPEAPSEQPEGPTYAVYFSKFPYPHGQGCWYLFTTAPEGEEGTQFVTAILRRIEAGMSPEDRQSLGTWYWKVGHFPDQVTFDNWVKKLEVAKAMLRAEAYFDSLSFMEKLEFEVARQFGIEVGILKSVAEMGKSVAQILFEASGLQYVSEQVGKVYAWLGWIDRAPRDPAKEAGLTDGKIITLENARKALSGIKDLWAKLRSHPQETFEDVQLDVLLKLYDTGSLDRGPWAVGFRKGMREGEVTAEIVMVASSIVDGAALAAGAARLALGVVKSLPALCKSVARGMQACVVKFGEIAKACIKVIPVRFGPLRDGKLGLKSIQRATKDLAGEADEAARLATTKVLDESIQVENAGILAVEREAASVAEVAPKAVSAGSRSAAAAGEADRAAAAVRLLEQRAAKQSERAARFGEKAKGAEDLFKEAEKAREKLKADLKAGKKAGMAREEARRIGKEIDAASTKANKLAEEARIARKEASAAQEVAQKSAETVEAARKAKQALADGTAVSARPPREGWVQHGQNTGGHPVEKHVGKTDRELVDRLGRDPVSASSSFPDLATAESVTSRTIDANRMKIETWLRSPTKKNLVLDFSGDGATVIGRGIDSGASNVINRTAAKVVLEKTADGSFHVLTAFPE